MINKILKGKFCVEERLLIKPIAHIKSVFPEKFGVPRQSGIIKSLEGKIIFEKEFRDGQALRCLEEYSHIWLIWGFSCNDASWSHTVRPPKLGGNKRVGVFATRSPFRPNPIGLSSVKLEKIEYDKVLGPVLTVCGADMVDGTPIYDIKPYIPYTDSHLSASCGFSKNAEEVGIDVVFPETLISAIPKELRSGVIEVLAQDPHPSYKKDDSREYYMRFSDFEIGFTVSENCLTVSSVKKAGNKNV